MLRNCLIYRPVGEFKNVDDIDLSYSLLDCAEQASGHLYSRIKKISEKIQNEKIVVNQEFNDHIEFLASLTVEAPRVTALGNLAPPMIDVTFPIWVMKSKPLILILDAGRKMAFPSSTILSMALFNKPNGILPIEVTLNNYLNMINGISQDGIIKRISFKTTIINNHVYKQLTLVGENLQSSDLFNQGISSSQMITELSFLSPKIRQLNRGINCKVSRVGSVTLYTPDLLREEIVRFMCYLNGFIQG